jgi:hypothetical protein
MIESDRPHADASRLKVELGPKICPSGFWGFRHSLGLPLTLKGGNLEENTEGERRSGHPADAATFILFRGAPQVLSGISTDPKFVRFETHACRRASRSAEF